MNQNVNSNLRGKTPKLLLENIGVNVCDFELGNLFLNDTQITSKREKYIKWTSSKFKGFGSKANKCLGIFIKVLMCISVCVPYK